VDLRAGLRVPQLVLPSSRGKLGGSRKTIACPRVKKKTPWPCKKKNNRATSSQKKRGTVEKRRAHRSSEAVPLGSQENNCGRPDFKDSNACGGNPKKGVFSREERARLALNLAKHNTVRKAYFTEKTERLRTKLRKGARLIKKRRFNSFMNQQLIEQETKKKSHERMQSHYETTRPPGGGQLKGHDREKKENWSSTLPADKAAAPN